MSVNPFYSEGNDVAIAVNLPLRPSRLETLGNACKFVKTKDGINISMSKLGLKWLGLFKSPVWPPGCGSLSAEAVESTKDASWKQINARQHKIFSRK